MDPTGEKGSPFSQKLPDWQSDLVAKIASRYPEFDQEELKAELAVTALAFERNPPKEVRDPKAYLARSLLNRATSLIREFRKRQKREIIAPSDIEFLDSSAELESSTRHSETRLEAERVRRRLDPDSYAFLQVLAKFNGNQTQSARFLGVHRNTVARRLRQIRRTLECPIQNVSGRLRLTIEQRRELERRVQDRQISSRGVFRAKLILALASGRSYLEIERGLDTTAPTISRWKHRFEKFGMNGLKDRYGQRKPRTSSKMAVMNWISSAGQRDRPKERVSVRQIAWALGISKSAVHRILKPTREWRDL